MSTKLITLLLAVTLLAGGCGGDDAEEALDEATTAMTDTSGAESTLEEVLTEAEEALGEAITLDLEEQNGSGITGTVSLSPTSDGEVEVAIEVDGSDGGPHPAHIHEGSCAELDPEPAFPLEDVVDGSSTTTVDVDIEDLTLSEYAVNVHESPENAATYVACGDVRNQ